MRGGRHRNWCDADLLIVLARSERSFLDRIPLYTPEGCTVPVDVFPNTTEGMRSLLESGHGCLRRALEEGTPIYERGWS